MEQTTEEKLRWEAYLYESNTRKQFCAIARRFRYFRFCRGKEGHGPDASGDSLMVGLRIDSEADLQRIFRCLEIPLIEIRPDEEVAQPGKSYTGLEYAKLVKPLYRFPRFREVGWTNIHGVKVFVYFARTLTISITDPEDVWSVTEPAFRAAESLEPWIALVADAVMDPPLDNKYCICPKYYPEFWQE